MQPKSDHLWPVHATAVSRASRGKKRRRRKKKANPLIFRSSDFNFSLLESTLASEEGHFWSLVSLSSGNECLIVHSTTPDQRFFFSLWSPQCVRWMCACLSCSCSSSSSSKWKVPGAMEEEKKTANNHRDRKCKVSWDGSESIHNDCQGNWSSLLQWQWLCASLASSHRVNRHFLFFLASSFGGKEEKRKKGEKLAAYRISLSHTVHKEEREREKEGNFSCLSVLVAVNCICPPLNCFYIWVRFCVAANDRSSLTHHSHIQADNEKFMCQWVQ